jgi:hypothetical protein
MRGWLRLAGGRVAVRAFDFTRFDSSSFEGWGDERVEKYEEDAEFSYRLTVEPDSGSYMRGIQLIRPLETISQYHDRLTHRYDSREYAFFVAQDWKNKLIREISCAPGATANYFTKSELPYETTPAFFRPEVLSKYKSDPSKYTLEERSISCRGAWSLRTYDINEAGQVHTYLVYLRDLPYAEQLYWKAFNEEPKAPLSKRAIGTDFEGQFWAEYNPLQSVIAHARELKEAGAWWWTLRSEDLLSQVHYPATDASEEWANEILALDKLLVEGFEERLLRQRATDLEQTIKPSDRSLLLVEACLRGIGYEEEAASKLVAPLRELHNLRSKLKGHASGSEASALRKAALKAHRTYRKHFADLCSRCDEALRAIAGQFG